MVAITKKCLLSLIYLLCSHLVSGQGYTIEFQLTGLEDGTAITLVPFAPYDTKPEAEAIVKDGRGSFAGTVPEPRQFSLRVDGKYMALPLMVENTNMTVTATLVYNESSKTYSWNNPKVTGSKSHDRYLELISVRQRLNQLHEEMYTNYASISTAIGKARQSGDKEKMDSLIQTQAYKDFEVAEKEFFKTVENRYNTILNQNKDSFWGPLMMLNLFSYFTPENRPTYEMMSEEAKTSCYGKMVYDQLYPGNKVGENVPDFTTHDQEGNPISLKQLLEGKKVILIDFWASWCAPCKKEIPNLKENYAEYHQKGFEILSFSIDKNTEAWTKAVKELALPWPNFLDLDVSSLYKVSAVPTTYLIDGDGKLIVENIRGEKLNAQLEKLLDR